MNMNQIATKKALFLDPTLKKIGPNPTSQLRARIFRKYFPKYLRNFDLHTKDGSIEAKVKRAKIFRNYKDSISPPSSQIPKIRLLLGSKTKFIKTLNNGSESPIRLIQKVKLFTNLRSIQLSLDLPRSYAHFFDHEEIRKRHLRKALITIQRFKNVKSLEFNQLLNSNTHLIQTINAFSRLLSSLNTLIISPGDAGDNDEGVLRILEDCKNLLKYVTSLRLPALRSPAHFQRFQSLQESCPKLKSLSFEFSCYQIFYNHGKATRYSCEDFLVEINYLSSLGNFHNLKSLELHIADTFTFVNDFVPPPSLQNLLLNFKECLTKGIISKVDGSFNPKDEKQVLEFFETNQTLVNFYSRFEDLQGLQALEILCSSHVSSEDYKYYNYLSQGILQSVPSLQRLSFAEGGFHWGLNKLSKPSLKDIYLPQLLQSCHNFRHTLQTLEIGHTGVTLLNLDFFSSQNSFPNLSTFIFTGTFHREDHLHNGIGLFLKQGRALGTSLKCLKLNTFIERTGESLVSLLQQLNQLDRPENLRIQLQVKFYEKQTLSIGPDFELYKRFLVENQQEYSKLRGVDLSMFMNVRNNEIGFFKVYGEKFDNFKILLADNSF